MSKQKPVPHGTRVVIGVIILMIFGYIQLRLISGCAEANQEFDRQQERGKRLFEIQMEQEQKRRQDALRRL